MKSALIGLLLLPAAHPVVASSLRKEWNDEDHPQSVAKFQRQPAGTTDDASHHRQLQLNGGHMFIVASKKSSDGRQWCMDAFQGPPGRHRTLQEEPVPVLINSNEPFTLSRKECTEEYGGTIVGDIGNGAIFRPDYVCDFDGNPPIGTVVASPGEPIASEGEVCCGSRREVTRYECVNDYGGSIVGDIGNGAIHRPGYRCESNAKAPIGTIYPLPGEPIAIEGEVCCGPKRRQNPLVGLRPCEYMAAPPGQLFDYTYGPSGDGNIGSRFYAPDYSGFCLMSNNGKKIPEAGDRVRLGPCTFDEPYYFNFEEIGLNGLADQIQVAGNPTLCVTFQGANPDDNDLLILKRCQDTSRFEWSFRSGWYELSSGDECVQVRNQNIQNRNRVVWDNCVGTGFSSHWRIDGQGLFHVRENDNFCMRAVRREAGAPVRIAPCNSRDPNQLWRWPDGFEAPVYLARNPNLRLVVQGRTPNPGNPMVLGTEAWEWSGDGV